MCFLKDTIQSNVKVKSPRSPRRHMYRQPTKPRLSRKIVRSARVNLNRYWSKFEEMAINKAPGNLTSSTDNEVNENILNQWREDSN